MASKGIPDKRKKFCVIKAEITQSMASVTKKNEVMLCRSCVDTGARGPVRPHASAHQRLAQPSWAATIPGSGRPALASQMHAEHYAPFASHSPDSGQFLRVVALDSKPTKFG